MSQLKVIKDGTELLVSFNFSLKTPKWKRSSCLGNKMKKETDDFGTLLIK